MRYNAVLEAGGVDDVVVDGLGVGLCVRIAKANRFTAVKFVDRYYLLLLLLLLLLCMGTG